MLIWCDRFTSITILCVFFSHIFFVLSFQRIACLMKWKFSCVAFWLSNPIDLAQPTQIHYKTTKSKEYFLGFCKWYWSVFVFRLAACLMNERTCDAWQLIVIAWELISSHCDIDQWSCAISNYSCSHLSITFCHKFVYINKSIRLFHAYFKFNFYFNSLFVWSIAFLRFH